MLEFHIIKLYLFLNQEKKNSILLSRKLKNQQQPIVLPIHDSMIAINLWNLYTRNTYLSTHNYINNSKNKLVLIKL
jgi:hypothetical protein